MPFAIIFLLVAGSIAIAWLYPHLRALALAVLALFTVIFTGAFFLSGSETTRQASLIPLEEVTLSDVAFEDDPRVGRISGNVYNGSEQYRLREFEIRLTLHDCDDAESDPDTDACVTIADATTSALVDVPPGQLRRFSAVLRFADRPEAEGVLVWRQQLVSTRATE